MDQQSNGTESNSTGSKSDADVDAMESVTSETEGVTVEGSLVTESDQNDQSAQDNQAAQADQTEEVVELTLEEQLQAALDEADALRDASLRSIAEQENLRRRTQRDVQNAHKFGAEKLLRELVDVVDSLEAALASDEPNAEGVQMTLDLLLKMFEKSQVVVVSPAGELFDPELHQAMTMQPSDEVAPNHVLQVIQKGYQLHDRLLRPAMVVVAKAPE